MTDRDLEFTPESTRAVLEVACERVGLSAADASLVRLGSNAIYRLASDPVIVRIARSAADLPTVTKEVDVAAWLASHKFPAAELAEVDDQPQQVQGMVVTYWRYIPGRPATTDDLPALGVVLRGLHELPAPEQFDLQPVDVLRQVPPRVASSPIPDGDKALLLDRCTELRRQIADLDFPLDQAAIHGDAHLNNLLFVDDQAVLLDFEGFNWGQPEWDLSMTATEYATAKFWTTEQYSSFAQGYGFDVMDWAGFDTLRATHEIKMTTWLMQNIDHSPEIAAEYQNRIHTIRTGEVQEPWRPF